MESGNTRIAFTVLQSKEHPDIFGLDIPAFWDDLPPHHLIKAMINVANEMLDAAIILKQNAAFNEYQEESYE